VNDEARNRRLFIASFLALVAAGIGFAIRGNGILNEWGARFGFTKAELGEISGLGLAGFGITIILGSIFADRIGYKPLMILAFLLHAGSAAVTLCATPCYEHYGAAWTKVLLNVGLTMFALANGVCESVINPLVATLYPRQKTHYLNILHAGWPAGLILGAVYAYLFVTPAKIQHLQWEIGMGVFLVPTIIYGIMVLRESFPHSEARVAGVTFGTMLREFASPILLFLFVLHALVGYVELGTDSWIGEIMNTVIIGKGVLLFIYTSSIMTVLRFFAGPIVERINPLGLLFISAVLGCVGLYWMGRTTTSDMVAAGTAGTAIFAAATIYGIGKTFFWPTMLGVVGERFPKGGALTMGTIGGIGMLSAGLLGAPGIGYKQDYYASQKLKETSPDTFDRYIARAPYSEKLEKFVSERAQVDGKWPAEYGNVVMKEKLNGFLFFPKINGLDGTKVANLKEKKNEIDALKEKNEPVPADKQLTPQEQKDVQPVLNANIYGGGMALQWTAVVPLTMAVGYLLLFIYFATQGGYKAETLHAANLEGEEYTGGVEAPVR
jgi:hypothetical protein